MVTSGESESWPGGLILLREASDAENPCMPIPVNGFIDICKNIMIVLFKVLDATNAFLNHAWSIRTHFVSEASLQAPSSNMPPPNTWLSISRRRFLVVNILGQNWNHNRIRDLKPSRQERIPSKVWSMGKHNIQ